MLKRASLPNLPRDRLAAVRGETKALPASAFLVTDLVNVRWLSGFTGSEASLLITPRKQFLLTDSRYVTQARAEARGYEVIQVNLKAQDTARMVRSLGLRRLAFEPEGMTHARFLEYRRALKGTRLVPTRGLVKLLRAIKSRGEIRLIQKAADVARLAFHDVVPLIKPGLRERELALALENRMRELGSGPPPFPTIVASGFRGALPHGVASDKRLKRNELITVDFGAVWQGYQSDQTVTVGLGRPGPRQKQVYDVVREAQARAMAAIRPGARAAEVDRVARNYIAEKGFGKYFGHGLGHGVGLETHEEPVLNPRSPAVLTPGMVVTVEPGIYLPGRFGVRIEDMVLVTDRGRKTLTRSSGELLEIKL